MKFSCEKQALQQAINTASRASASKSPIPTLEGLLINAGYQVRITGYDLKKAIYTDIEADVSEPGAAVLGAKMFVEMIRRMPDGVIEITVDDKNNATIKCGRSVYNMMAMDASEYPELPDIDMGEELPIPQKTLKSMINETIFAVSTNESRPVYMGALFEKNGNELTVAAVDGYRLAIRREDLDTPLYDGKTFIVPGAALSDVERICEDSDEPVLLILNERHVSFNLGSTTVVSRRLEGEFLNYRKAVPETFRAKMKVDRSEFLSIVDRVSLVVDEKIKNPVRLIFRDNAIDFFCVTPLGRAEDVCSAEGNGEDTEIGFNDRYLREALRNAPADELLVCINTGSSPCVFTSTGETSSFTYMILPVRLRAGD